jgi:hypothetical protein
MKLELLKGEKKIKYFSKPVFLIKFARQTTLMRSKEDLFQLIQAMSK